MSLAVVGGEEEYILWRVGGCDCWMLSGSLRSKMLDAQGNQPYY